MQWFEMVIKRITSECHAVLFLSCIQSETFLVEGCNLVWYKILSFFDRGKAHTSVIKEEIVLDWHIFLEFSGFQCSCPGAKQALEAVTHLSFRGPGQLCYSRLNTQ